MRIMHGSTRDKVLVLVTICLIFFRNSISTILGGVVGNIALLSLFLITPFFLSILLHHRFKPLELISILYVFYLFILVILYPIFAEVDSIIPSFIGFVNLGGFFIFWFSLFKSSKNEGIFHFSIRLFLALGVINALGAITQFYISENLFGLINHSIYSDSASYLNENITRRAISFITSPQSLSLFLAFILSISLLIKLGFFWGLMVRGIILFAGVLTLSKAFVVFLLVFFCSRYFSLRHYIPLFFVFVAILFIANFGEYFGRVGQIFYFLLNIEEYSAYRIWIESIEYASKFPDVIFGKGIGVFSRGGQQLGNYTILHGSTESYFIQVFVELGSIGLFFLVALLSLSLVQLFSINRTIFSCLLAFCTVGLFSPALYGYVCGGLFYFCLAFGLTKKPTP